MIAQFFFLAAIVRAAFPAEIKTGSPLILLTNHGNVQLIPVTNPNNTLIVASGLQQAIACDFIYEDRLIFWMDAMDYGKGKIQYANMSQHTSRVKVDVLRSGMAQPDGLTCDWIGKKLYWTDAETSRIEVSEIDGSSRKVLIWNDLDQPRAIAVDPSNAFMYWTDWGEAPKIERAGMDGTRRQVLVDKNIYWPNGITLDYDERKVYWVEANYHFIHRINMDGTQREEVINSERIHLGFSPTADPLIMATTTSAAANNPDLSRGEDEGKPEVPKLYGALQHPFAISLHKEYIYWTDWATNSIHSMYKNGTGLPALVKGNDMSPMDLQIYSADRQKPGDNPCHPNNGGCSHLCLLSPDPPFYSCACPTGVRIRADNMTCEDGPNEILLLARRADIRVISLDTADHTDVLVPVNHIKHAVAVEYDPVDGYVYWSDDGEKAILRSHLNGSGFEVVITNNVEQSDGIAIDWIARNLYWTDTGHDFIAVSRLNGTSRKILIDSGIEEPRAIVLDPVAGHMYWTDWGAMARIERANLDGSGRILFVSIDLEWPNGLALDHRRSVLYWADAGKDRIEKINLNGTGRKIVLSDGLPHIFGLSLLGNYLYWTDWQRRRIERMKIGDRRSRKILIDQLPDMMGIKATSKKVLPGTNICAVNNGRCSHLCLYSQGGERCHCPDGMDLAPDMSRCVVPEAFLLFSFTNAYGIRKISLDTARGDSLIPFNVKVDASFLDFSSIDNKIYWTNTKDMTILRSFMNGTNVEHFIDVGIEMLEGLAVDWIGRNVYWADSSTNRIEVASMDRPSRRSVVWNDIESPRCLALDPSNGYIYWSEWGSEPCIKRAEMDGSHVIQIVKKGTTGRANSLTIDYAEQRLYWVDFEINVIMSANMQGNKRLEIIAGQGSKSISSLALYGDHIFWSDSKHQSIERANKNSGGDRRVIESGVGDIDDIFIYHVSRQSGVTSCSHNNGGCQHLCLSLPGGLYKCSCPAHFILNKDNVTCTAPTNFLLISQARYISRIVFRLPMEETAIIPGIPANHRSSNPNGYGALPSPDAVLPVRGMEDACSLDYDPFDRRLYWLDCVLGEIKSSRPNGTRMEVLLKGNFSLYHPYDIALDPYSRLLFWTDALSNSIRVMDLDGNSIGTVLSGTVGRKQVKVMPRKLTIEPLSGLLFFTNVCDDITTCRLKIMQSALDGSDCMILFDRGLRNVSALAVDGEGDRLYWVDQSKIQSSRLDGTDRIPLIQTNLAEPVGLAVFGQDLFWVDSQTDGGLIEGADKVDGSNRRRIQSRMKNIRDIISVVEADESVLLNHPCFLDNGECSHLCVPQEDGTTKCSCPNHLVLAGDSQCEKQPTCSPEEFSCERKTQCIPQNWRCDGQGDCDDGTDEINCPASHSCEGKFICDSGVIPDDSRSPGNFLETVLETKPQCIPMRKRCDGTKDCYDHSDELNCYVCKSKEKICPSGECVPASADCHAATPLTPEVHDNTPIIALCVTFGCFLLIGIGLFLRHCMHNDKSHYPPGLVMFTPSSNGHLNLNVEFQPRNEINHISTSAIRRFKKASSFNLSIVPSGNPGSGGIASGIGWPTYESGQLAERPLIPGASSVSSAKHSLPVHPAPSYQCGDFACSSDSPTVRTSSYYRCKKGHKHKKYTKPNGHGPPPPTPCTTDTCEDFDSKNYGHSNGVGIPHEPPPPYHSCCYHCYHKHNSHHCGSSSTSTSSRHRGRDDCGEPPSYDRHRPSRRRHRYVTSDLNSDSDPYAPPPTPRSQYMSECCETTEVEDATEIEAITARIDDLIKEDNEDETELLIRSSPSITERSYCIYNPPPSPVTD